MHRRVLFSLTCAAALLQGCATISSDECQVADWRTVGLEDGARGAPPDAIGRYRKACAEHGIAPDLDAYMQGRAEGLQSYCTPGNGFNVGSLGAAYAGVCPADAEHAFLDAYAAGHHLYELEAAASAAQSRVDHTTSELARLKRTMAGKEAALVSGEISTEERVQLALDLKDMAKRQGELEHDLPGLRREADKRNKQLARYRSQLAYSP